MKTQPKYIQNFLAHTNGTFIGTVSQLVEKFGKRISSAKCNGTIYKFACGTVDRKGILFVYAVDILTNEK